MNNGICGNLKSELLRIVDLNKKPGKITGNLLLFVNLIILISACNHSSTKDSFEKNGSGKISQQVFLIGNGSNSKWTISDMIEKSGIRKGGYVVIIPTSFIASDSNANVLKQDFYKQKIMAVHILEFPLYSSTGVSQTTIKNTDVLSIENASIICLLNGKKNKFMKLANNTRIKKSLLKAKKNGALIAGIGRGASILGGYYYSRAIDTLSQKLKIKLKPGLGLLKNTIIDDIVFFRNYQKGIQQNSTRKNFVFFGLNDRACIWIKNDDALVLRKPKIVLITPGMPKKLLCKGDSLKLFPDRHQ